MSERHNRQMLIEGWKQEALDKKIVVVGDDPVYTGLFVLSSAALGIVNQRVISPTIDDKLIEIAKKIEPGLKLEYYQGNYNTPLLNNFLMEGSSAVIDLTNHNLSKKIMLNESNRRGLDLVLSSIEKGVNIYNYKKGREFEIVHSAFAKRELKSAKRLDPVAGLIASGLILEETKKILMGENTTEEPISYQTSTKGLDEKTKKDVKVLIVGAGALGNFVSLSLGYLGVKNIEIIDPDKIEETNLNRQILFYDKVGEEKSTTLANRVNELFGLDAKPIVGYYRKETDISKYDAIFDCVDNFETRIALSEAVKARGKTLISGGTSFNAGQVVAYLPRQSEKTPAEFLGLYEIVDKRKLEKEYTRVRASCTYRPDPSVIMSNEIVGGMMVDVFRKIMNNESVKMTYYNAASPNRVG